MKKDILLKITGVQRFQDDEPERTELVTDGTLERTEDALLLSYAESELTGMVGTTTTFRIEPERVLLTRSGRVQSQMIFTEGKEDQSLYDTGFGALMISVTTERIRSTMGENGGVLEVSYRITIENEVSGTITYRIEAREK